MGPRSAVDRGRGYFPASKTATDSASVRAVSRAAMAFADMADRDDVTAAPSGDAVAAGGALPGRPVPAVAAVE
jgi:hypothetical protein